MSTSLRLPSEAADYRVRSAEVKDGHLLPALDGSYARGHSNELAHPLVDAHRAELAGPESPASPLRDAYIEAAPPKLYTAPPAFIVSSLAQPEAVPRFSPDDRKQKRRLATALRGPLGRFAAKLGTAHPVAKGPGTVMGGVPDLRVFRGGYATPFSPKLKRGVTPPAALVPAHADRPQSPNSSFVEFSACDSVPVLGRQTRHPRPRAYDGAIAQRIGLAGVSPATLHCEGVARAPSVDLPLSAGKASLGYRDTSDPAKQARLDAVEAAAREIFSRPRRSGDD